MTPEIYRLYADNKPLPKGTRIATTLGGIQTGETHELGENVLASANSVPNHMSDYVPFWILGWRDLHDWLSIPANTNRQTTPPVSVRFFSENTRLTCASRLGMVKDVKNKTP